MHVFLMFTVYNNMKIHVKFHADSQCPLRTQVSDRWRGDFYYANLVYLQQLDGRHLLANVLPAASAVDVPGSSVHAGEPRPAVQP
jgi:hypothetical protein